MARVRNLIYNGVTVEQPVFNGVNLTKWIHDGVVVWEQGDVIIDVEISQALSPAIWDSDAILRCSHNGSRVYCIIDEYNSTTAASTVSCYSFVLGEDTYRQEWVRGQNTDYFKFKSITPSTIQFEDEYGLYCLGNPWSMSDAITDDYSNIIQIAESDTVYAIREYGSYLRRYGEIVQVGPLQTLAYISSNILSAINNYSYGVVFSTSLMYMFTRIQTGNPSRWVLSGVTHYNTSDVIKTVSFSKNVDFGTAGYFNEKLVGIRRYTYGNTEHYVLCAVELDDGTYEDIVDLNDVFASGSTIKSVSILGDTDGYRTDINQQYIGYKVVVTTNRINYTHILLMDKQNNLYRVENVANYLSSYNYIVSVGNTVYIMNEGERKIYSIEIPQNL